MPFITPRLEIITMGKGTIVNVSKNIISFAKRKFEGKSSYEILTSKFVYGVNPYYLPDVENLKEIENKLVGIACASADSKTMWQIGVDVFPEYRGNGIAVKLVNMLTIETLNRGIVPYYTTDCANINSQKVAIKSGYIPAWTHCFKTRLPKIYRR